MSELTDAIKNNGDLSRAIYMVVSQLAAARLSGQMLGFLQLTYLADVCATILPHLPIPPEIGR